MSTVVDFTPTVNLLFNAVASIVVSVVVPWVGLYLANKLHIDAKSATAQRILTAAENGASLAISKANIAVDQHASIDVKNQMIATGASYVQATLEPELAKMGVTPEHLDNMIEAKIQQQLAPPPAPAVVAAVAPAAK